MQAGMKSGQASTLKKANKCACKVVFVNRDIFFSANPSPKPQSLNGRPPQLMRGHPGILQIRRPTFITMLSSGKKTKDSSIVFYYEGKSV